MYNPQSWPQTLNLSSQGANATYITTANTYTTGVLPLNGAGTSGGNYVNATPSFVTITSNGNDSTTNFTFNFIDLAGRAFTYTIAGPNNTTLIIPIPMYTILAGGITVDQDTVGTVSLGISSQTATVWVPFDLNRTEFNDIIEVTVNSGTLTYTVEYTNQNALVTIPTIILEDQTLVNADTSGTTVVPNSVCFARIRFPTYSSGSITANFVTSGAYASFKNF